MMMNQEKTEKNVPSPVVVKIDPLVDDEQKPQPGGHNPAAGDNLEKFKTTAIEKAGEVKTIIVEKAVEVKKSIDQMLHKTTPPIEEQPHQVIEDEHKKNNTG